MRGRLTRFLWDLLDAFDDDIDNVLVDAFVELLIACFLAVYPILIAIILWFPIAHSFGKEYARENSHQDILLQAYESSLKTMLEYELPNQA